MAKTYDLFKAKLFLDALAEISEEQTTEHNLTDIERQLKTCLSTEQALLNEVYANKRDIEHIEEELRKIEAWHNQLLMHEEVSPEKKKDLRARIEHTKQKLKSIQQQL